MPSNPVTADSKRSLTQPVRGLLLVCTVALASCAVAAGPSTQGSAELEAKLRGLIGDAACSSNAQCRTVAFGAKACGGPQSYLAWSVLQTDEAALKAAAERFAESRRAENRESGRVSDCSVVADPGASCVATAPGTAGPARACRLGSTRGAVQ